MWEAQLSLSHLQCKHIVIINIIPSPRRDSFILLARFTELIITKHAGRMEPGSQENQLYFGGMQINGQIQFNDK